ncbi:isoleucyl-tRNA synthetase [Escherichia coli]|uniref:Isoleucyl-tRNA synthetase n=1 Tax=Escherichia coli TaxID=562 RepID=A0A2X1Q030_ECOLX|nr:isoleucyl-tRNA synthetase [Escherichia coli]
MLGDWSHPYLTMDFKTEANIIRALGKIIGNGHLHKGAKPVHWCVDCRSALAEAEVEYYDKTSPSIDVAFQAVDQDALKAKFAVSNVNGPISLVIWTLRRGLCLRTAQSLLHLISTMRWCRSTVRP